MSASESVKNPDPCFKKPGMGGGGSRSIISGGGPKVHVAQFELLIIAVISIPDI